MSAQYGPLGDRLRNALYSAIEDGVIAAGAALPSERELAQHLDVSRSTLRHCLKELAAMGMLHTRPGAGTVVTGRISKALSRLSGFSEDMQTRGLAPESQVLELQAGPVPPTTAFRTGLPLSTRTLTLGRLRLAGGDVYCYERAIVPIEAVGEDYDGAGSLYERMEARGARPQRILQTLEAVEAPLEIARLLGVREGAALLRITQIGYGDEGTAVEDAVSWYRGDRYKYVGELKG